MMYTRLPFFPSPMRKLSGLTSRCMKFLEWMYSMRLIWGREEQVVQHMFHRGAGAVQMQKTHPWSLPRVGGGPDQSAITMYDDFKGQVTEGFLEEVTVERNSEGRVHQVHCDKGKRARQESEWQDLEMKPRKAFRSHLPGSTPTEDMRGPQGTKEAFRRLFWKPDWGEQEHQ